MWVIMENAFKERMRRKELYIVVGIGIFILLLCGSGTGTITIDGEPITSFDNMFMVLHTMMNAVGCILAVVLSIRTIPNEYERRNSHLIWVRGISQTTYHAGLTLANIFSAMMAMGILYLALAGYIVINSRMDYLACMIPAFLIVCVNVAVASILTSVLSIKLPGMVAGMIGFVVVFVGILHGVLDVYKNIAGGVAGIVLRGLLMMLPDMNGIQAQAQNLMARKTVNVHVILVGVLAIYVISIGLFVCKKKEA
ncbi:MAG: hypothetical protein PUA75_08965 [Clostridiales bacterium]|nr:hypothetical protein [Clostridiales bacterium]